MIKKYFLGTSFVLGLTVSFALAEEAEQPPPPVEAAEETKKKKPEQKRDGDFKPTEQISEDYAVAFPVDI